MRRQLICLALALAPVAAAADDFTGYTVEDDFESVTFAVEQAILGRGLVIDSTSHVGDMLERTKADVGGTVTLFEGAEAFLFCSAAVSREVMEADPLNIRHCPYAIHVFAMPDMPGKVMVSHRTHTGTMAPVQDLLAGIVADAIGN
ncbi:MAG: DUF302 domain-containing protein [Paracoccaceae bacterium]|nr:MAG: DUF302 domain-containing protein [Paracoccaceae bacterium]